MRSMNFENVVACIHAATGRFAPSLEHCASIHGLRRIAARKLIERAGARPCHGAQPYSASSSRSRRQSSIAPAGCLTSRMPNLDRWDGVLFLDEVSNTTVHRDMLVVPDAGAHIGFPSTCFDASLFTKYDSGTADRQTADMHHLPVAGSTVIRMVLTHRGDNDAVLCSDAAYRDWCEQQRSVLGVLHRRKVRKIAATKWPDGKSAESRCLPDP